MLYFVVGYKNKPKNEQKKTKHLSCRRAVRRFLSLTAKLPRFTTSWLLFPPLVVPFCSMSVCLWHSPLSSWKQDNSLRVTWSTAINPTRPFRIFIISSANLRHPRLVGLRVAAFSCLPLQAPEVLSSLPEQLDTNNIIF